MVRLRTYPDRTEAHLALARLHGEGIHAMLRNDTIHGILPVGALDVQLWVREEDAEAAGLLLQEPAGSPAMAEDHRDIGHRGIEFLRRRQQRRRYRPLVWLLIVLLVLLLILIGW